MAQTPGYKFDVGEIVVHVLDKGFGEPPKYAIGIIVERSQTECYRHAPQNSYKVRFAYQASAATKEAFGLSSGAQPFSEIELKAA